MATAAILKMLGQRLGSIPIFYATGFVGVAISAPPVTILVQHRQLTKVRRENLELR